MTSERDVIDSLHKIHSNTLFFKKWEKVGPPRLKVSSSVLSGHLPLRHIFVLSCALISDFNYFTFSFF